MPVKRNKDGSITIQSSNGVTAVAGISAVEVHGQKESFNSLVEYYAKKIIACDHTIQETEKHFLELCDALPLDQDDHRMKSFQCNVVMNHFHDKLEHQPKKFSFDMTDQEMEEWQKEQSAAHDEACNSSPERFGLKMRGYLLPHTGRNESFYEKALKKHEEMISRMEQMNAKRTGRIPGQESQVRQQDICFFFEETTGHIQSSGGGDELMQQLIVFRGVTREDIDKRSPRFLGYISTLRDMGKLPELGRDD